jgi:hypothetical protein
MCFSPPRETVLRLRKLGHSKGTGQEMLLNEVRHKNGGILGDIRTGGEIMEKYVRVQIGGIGTLENALLKFTLFSRLPV